MSLIPCEECENPISTRALFCPKCGCPAGTAENKVVAPTIETPAAQLTNFGETFPHPGPMPDIKGSWNIKRKFGSMGTLAGRHYDEIVQVVGAPKSRGQQAFGTFLCQWMSIHPMYHIALIFDQNGICGGVTHESS